MIGILSGQSDGAKATLDDGASQRDKEGGEDEDSGPLSALNSRTPSPD